MYASFHLICYNMKYHFDIGKGMIMSEIKKRICILAFREGLLIVIISAVVALTANQFHPGSISIFGEWSLEARMTTADGNLMIVSLEDARKLFEIQEATFIDARPEEDYYKGHIEGALSLPWIRFDDYFVEIVDQLDPGKPIITYCDGETCDLSHQLALFLIDMGFDDSRVLVNGWSLWLKAGLPIKTDPGAEG
jgi:rhodanese-related sulfurtransferase